MQVQPARQATSEYVRGGVIRPLQRRIDEWSSAWELLYAGPLLFFRSRALEAARTKLVRDFSQYSYMVLRLSQSVQAGGTLLKPGYYRVQFRAGAGAMAHSPDGIGLAVRLFDLPGMPSCMLWLHPDALDSVYELVPPGTVWHFLWAKSS